MTDVKLPVKPAPTLSQACEKPMTQHAADLEKWLKERGLAILVIAVGKRTGGHAPIADFMPDTHEATFALVQVQP